MHDRSRPKGVWAVIDLNISKNEKAYLSVLSTLYERGSIDQQGPFQNLYRDELIAAGADLSDFGNFRVVMGLMEECCAIKKVKHDHDGRANKLWFDEFEISPKAVILARELVELERKAKEPGDLVAQTADWARQHKVWSRAIIGCFIAATLFTTFNGCVQAVNTVVGVFKPSPQSSPSAPPPQEHIVKIVQVPPEPQSKPEDKQSKSHDRGL
jgi:hypothetical protein